MIRAPSTAARPEEVAYPIPTRRGAAPAGRPDRRADGGEVPIAEIRESLLEGVLAAARPGPPPMVGVWRTASSTNELAIAASGDCPAELWRTSVFLAGEQTAGRGRYGRSWISPPGGLYLSLLAAPPGGSAGERSRNLPLLPIAAGLAVAGAVRNAAGAEVTIRWPNDLDLEGRKVAGVLAETGFQRSCPELAVVGFGINCGPVHLPPPGPGTGPPLRTPGWLPEGVSRGRLAGALVSAFRETLALWERDPVELRARWESLSPCARGRRCRVSFGENAWIAGTTAGLEPDGGLRVYLDGGGVRVVHASEAIRVDHPAAAGGDPGGP